MRVAIVQETIDARRGGAETSTLEMAHHLARLGLDVTILCRTAPVDLPTADNLHILPLPAGGFTRALRTYRFIQAVHRLCRRTRFDIVHAVTPCLSADVYQPRGGTYAETVQRGLEQVASPALRQLKRLGRRFNIRQRFLYRLELLLLQKRRHRVFVAAISDYVRRQVVSGYGFPPERVRVVFNGVDITSPSAEEAARVRRELRERIRVGPDTPLVLFAAHNFKLKGLAELIRACAAGVAPADDGWPAASAVGNTNSHENLEIASPWTLVIAGRDRRDQYVRLAHDLGIAPRVRFVGTTAPIEHWYAAADALAHPTWYDPCSRVVLEALSLGLPVVTTRLNGAAEVIEPGRHGELVDSPADIPALAAAIAKALRPELRAACRADAARLREELSMARHARDLKTLYNELVALWAG